LNHLYIIPLFEILTTIVTPIISITESVVWFLGIFLTIFVGIVSLEGTLSSSVDGITAKSIQPVLIYLQLYFL